eukprot:6752634-Prymnesium_polylepis.1
MGGAGFFYTLAAARRRENCEIMRPRLTFSTRNDPRRLPAHHGPLKPLPAPDAPHAAGWASTAVAEEWMRK